MGTSQCGTVALGCPSSATRLVLVSITTCLKKSGGSAEESRGGRPHMATHFYVRRFDSNEKTVQLSPSFSNGTASMFSPVNSAMARFQKLNAVTFDCITRTSHTPGNRFQTSCAIRVPVPRLRYARRTKNSAISHRLAFPETSDPFFTKTNPANLPSTQTRNG